jgi:DNA-binding transcriptional LysR family regulator
MKRRDFIAGLGGAAAWPHAARAQQAERVRRVGVLMNNVATDTVGQSYLTAFTQGLRQLGWAGGQNLRMDVRWSASDVELARTYAAQLIGLMPDAILTSTTSRIGRRIGLRDLHVFIAVVQRGSMAKAAQQLNVTQPAVSKAIADLEHAFGVRLLDRGPEGVEPTMYGRALLHRSNVVFDELKQSVRDIEFLADPTVGEVRFGCHESVAAAILPRIMETFSPKYPRVELRMEQIGAVGIVPDLPSLCQRHIDFAMFRLSKPFADQLPLNELDIEILFNDQLVVAAARHNRWARCQKIDISELVREPWILSGPDTWNYIELMELCRARGVDMPKISLETISNAVRVSLLATGLYIGTFPRSSMHLYADRFSLAVLPVDLPIRPWPVVIAKLRNRTLSPVVERFIECARGVAKLFDAGALHSRRKSLRTDRPLDNSI